MADDVAGAVRRTPRPTEDTCRAYDVDDETVRVHGGRPLDEAGQAALGEIVRAATAKLADEHPNLGVTQELIMAGLAATRAIPDGEVRGGCTIQDGAKVKARLKAAIGAARDALSTERRPTVLLRADDCACRYGEDCPHGPEPVDALDLAVWLHAESEWWLSQYKHDVTLWKRQVDELTGERDALQARLDAVRTVLDRPWPDDEDHHDFVNGQVEAARAALRGVQPTEPTCIYVVVPGEGGSCITPAVHDGLCAEHLAVVETEKAQHVYEDDAAHNWAGICRVCSCPPGGPQHLDPPAQPTGEADRG